MLASNLSFPIRTLKNRLFSFGPERRLRFRREFLRFFDRSQVLRLSECTVFRIPNELGHFRLGITLKARGTSLERNRVKRQIRESFRNVAPLLGSFDYNVVVPATRKISHPFHLKLGACLRRELLQALPQGASEGLKP